MELTRMKAERLRRGMSLLQCGFHANVQPSELSRLERRLAIPYPGQAARIAAVLGLAPAELQQTAMAEAVAS